MTIREVGGRYDSIFQELRDSLFLCAMTYGQDVKTAYEQAVKPAEVEFEAREWDVFKPIYAVGTTLGNPNLMNALSEFANARYQDKIKAYSEQSLEHIVLQVLLRLVKEKHWYSVDEVMDALKAWEEERGVPVKSPGKKGRGISP